MRQSIIVGMVRGPYGWGMVGGTIGTISHNRTLVSDRRANGDHFACESAVRLPRSLRVSQYHTTQRPTFRRTK